MAHIIRVIGIGPGSEDYILPIAKKAILAAEVMVGSKRALDTLISKETRDRVQTCVIDKNIDHTLAFIEEQLESHDVVVMVSGDPGFYSFLPALKRRFLHKYRIEVIPGISSMQLAFARITEIWQDAELISVHGRETDFNMWAYAPGKKLAFLTDSKHSPMHIAQSLLQTGWPEETRSWLCSNLSYDSEQVEACSLREVADKGGPLHCVMVVIS